MAWKFYTSIGFILQLYSLLWLYYKKAQLCFYFIWYDLVFVFITKQSAPRNRQSAPLKSQSALKNKDCYERIENLWQPKPSSNASLIYANSFVTKQIYWLNLTLRIIWIASFVFLDLMNDV